MALPGALARSRRAEEVPAPPAVREWVEGLRPEDFRSGGAAIES